MVRPPLHALQGFVSVARLGNMSRAAAAMHLTVSALSHQMHALEERLGQRLFDRHARGVTLTSDGRRLLERIGPHLDAIGEALQPFAARRDHVLTISLTPSMASAWLVPRLGDFLARQPQIEINLLSDKHLVDFERQPQVDAGLRIGNGQWPGLAVEMLFDEWLVPVASPALIARIGGRGRVPLAQWPLIGDPDGEWERWFTAAGDAAPARYVAVFDDSESQHRAALDGVGVALGRVTRTRLMLDAGQLVPLSPHRVKASWSHYLVYPPRSAAHAGFLAFRDWLRKQADEHLPPMAAPAAPKRRRARG